MADQDTMSVKEFAKRFRVHESTVRGCVKRQEIYAARIGRQIRIPVAELRRLLTGNVNTVPAAA